MSIFDLNGDGKVDAEDFRIAAERAHLAVETRKALAFGAAEMRSENDLCASFNEQIERRERGADTAVVSDLAVAVEGDVEIGADEDAPPGKFAVGQQGFN